jgi:nitroreductase
MNETLKLLEERRSVRSYENKPVPEEDLKQIVEAGLYAPSAMGRQDAAVLVITNRELRDALARENAAVMGSTADPFYGAPVVMVVIAKRSATAIETGSAMIMNLIIAATSLGLASCWIHRAKEELESDFGRQLLEKAGYDPAIYQGIGNVILGYDKGPLPTARPRLPGRVAYLK